MLRRSIMVAPATVGASWWCFASNRHLQAGARVESLGWQKRGCIQMKMSLSLAPVSRSNAVATHNGRSSRIGWRRPWTGDRMLPLLAMCRNETLREGLDGTAQLTI